MRRFTLTNCLLGLFICSPAVRGLADGLVPPRPVLVQCRVLEGLVGTWDTQISSGSAEVLGKPKPYGRITRGWVADHHFVHEQGSGHEAYIAFDPRQNLYRAWYFHANGHVWELTGGWTGNMNMLLLSANLDQNQSLQRQFQLLNDKNHECTVTWTDEDGRTGVYGVFSFSRCEPAPAPNSGKISDPPGQSQSSPPAEMEVFRDEIGKWTLEGSAKHGETTTKVKGTSVVQWILGGRFVQTTTSLQGQEGESISIAGFDAATKTYRCWYFVADSIFSEPAFGTWDEKERSMAWKEQVSGDLVMLKKKQWINHDTAKFHSVFTRQNGGVETTQDGTLTRQKTQ